MGSMRRLMRRLLLPIFARVNPGDITVRHHYTGDRIRLHSFHHRPYWFYGKRREPETMRFFADHVEEGAVVLDVGGHIGYTALYLASLVGPKGRVFVFEPGPNNLQYLRDNVQARPNITLVESALGSQKGKQSFFVEDLSGQNNSFIRDYSALTANAASANFKVKIDEVTVDVLTMDEFCRERTLRPHLIKIDVEGFEFEVLQGAMDVMQRCRPVLVVEIAHRRRDAVYELMSRTRYLPIDVTGEVLKDIPTAIDNVFFVPRETVEEHEDGTKQTDVAIRRAA
jgi:FkbM family methyltransferase